MKFVGRLFVFIFDNEAAIVLPRLFVFFISNMPILIFFVISVTAVRVISGIWKPTNAIVSFITLIL